MAASTKKTAGFKETAKPAAVPRVNAGEGKIDDVQVTHLQVRAQAEGFRRAGRAWSVQETTVPIDEFTAEQVEQLLAEPQLVVTPVAIKAE